MNAFEIVAAGTGILAAGAYLRWAITPACLAYEIGRYVGAWRKTGHLTGDKHPILAERNRPDGQCV